MIKKSIVLLSLCIWGNLAWAQDLRPVAQKVESLRASGASFETFRFLEPASATVEGLNEAFRRTDGVTLLDPCTTAPAAWPAAGRAGVLP